MKKHYLIVKGERVLLRPIRMSDAARFVRWFRDPQVRRLVSNRGFMMREEVQWIRGLSRKRATERHFAIETTEGVHIGSCGLHLNPRYKNAVLGIVIGDRRFWNKGLGTEAMRLLLDYGFYKLKLHRISLKVYAYNPRARSVYKKLGFRVEGRGREEVFSGGTFHDDIHMGILASEWNKKRKR